MDQGKQPLVAFDTCGKIFEQKMIPDKEAVEPCEAATGRRTRYCPSLRPFSHVVLKSMGEVVRGRKIEIFRKIHPGKERSVTTLGTCMFFAAGILSFGILACKKVTRVEGKK